MINRREFNQSLLALIPLSLASPFTSANVQGNIITKSIPSSGENIPAIGMGTWITFDTEKNLNGLKEHIAILSEFFQQGGQMIDSSPMYGMAQKVLGMTLPKATTHNQLFSATKVWTYGEQNGIKQMQASAKLWGLEQFDLMHVHNMLDWNTHLSTLHKWQSQGKLKYTGITTSHGRRHKELLEVMKKQKLDFVQFTYNIHDTDAEKYLLPMAQDKGIAVVINRPFQTNGLFSRVNNKPLPDWASEINCGTWAQFFLKFVISHPAVTCAIPATSQLKHMQENMQALYGKQPDTAMRKEMVKYYLSII